ncbi:MAG: hypothetical protein HY744_12590, partial [Deltaproteobacteria bacterium]|nr:hypothetical protein [Deltaproteobacteria bacterium]
MDDYGRLHALLGATEPLGPAGEGGSHTDVLRFDAGRLRRAVADASGQAELGPGLERLVTELAEGYLVKKGKIDLFSMPLVGRESSHLRRPLVSHAFGPVGYNLMPTFEKTVQDATEAVRLVPYFGFGPPSGFCAPDFLAWLRDPPRDDAVPANDAALFLRTACGGDELGRSAYELLADDEYFHA